MDTPTHTTTGPLPAGIYARISADLTREGLGVARQVDDCTELAQAKGWEVVDTYPENDTSATRAKSRPQYERLIRDVESGRIKAIAIWDIDRLTRSPRELEDLVDLADKHGLALGSVGGEIDLGTPQGRMTARIKGTVARHETDQLSRRVRRKLAENATNGQVHAPVAYGYRRVVERDEHDRKIRSYDVIDKAEAAILVEAKDRVLAGQSIRSVVADLNERQVPVPRNAKRWATTSLRDMLIRERNVGRRSHNGQVVAKAQWKPLWDQNTHDRLVALLTDPRRSTYRGRTRKYLLTGIAGCGRCGGKVVLATPHQSGSLKPGYVCGECRGVRRAVEPVDRTVEEYMIELLSTPGAMDKVMIGDPAEVQAATARRDAAKARMDLAAIEFGHGRWDAEQVATVNAICIPEIRAAQAIIDAHQPPNLPTDIAGPDAADNWAAANLDQKRALIKAFVTITIMPSGGGRRRFDPSLIVIDEVNNP